MKGINELFLKTYLKCGPRRTIFRPLQFPSVFFYPNQVTDSLIIFSAVNSSRVFKKITVMAIAPRLIPTNLPMPQLPSAMATIARKLSTKLHLRYPGRISQKENASASASIVASFLYDTEIFRLSKRPTFSIRWSRIHICKEESLAPTSCQTSTPWA